jgi:energy-converting hydrogenase Eha subunit H
MPIQLTDPYDPGDGDSVVYNQVKIISIHEQKIQRFFRIYCQYGNTVGSVWTPGVIDIAQYSTILNLLPVSSDTGYVTLYKGLYQYLIDLGIYPGTII